MSDTPPIPPSPPTPPVGRPSRPSLAPRAAPAGRPVRPRPSGETVAPPLDVPPVEPPAPPPVIADATVVALPPRPARPSAFASTYARQTLVPPCGVLAVGLLTLGVAYFCQPADAATRQWSPALALLAIGLGVALAAVTLLLAASARRVDSGATHS